ncbi:unnamed protein product [Nezara viridula]|uniref:Daxx histone-binding domain-containing protein n=1 Tax=Nezara viridula TaxID=85310 RepID=A0A9P0HG23_NEZVI|nr:unnamed protein product [Nezara viridula]
MSVSFIDLSSDEEIEIVTEKKVCPKTKNNPTVGSSAVQKLKRNFNIELTINLENSQQTKENEKVISRPVEKNGFTSFKNLQRILSSTPKHSLNGDNAPRKDSLTAPDVIIIDSDEVKEERPQRPKEAHITPTLASLKINTKPNSIAEKASNVVVENGDEVFIIDDDDEDDTTSSTSQLSKTTKTPQISAKIFNQKAGSSLPQNKPNSTPTTSKVSTPSLPVSAASKPVYNKVHTIVVPLSSVFASPSSSMPKVSLLKPTSKNEEIVILSDETDQKKESTTRALRPRQKNNSPRLSSSSVGGQTKSQSSTKANSSVRDSNGNSSGQSTSKSLLSQIDLTVNVSLDKTNQERINRYSVENMFDGLVKVSCKLFQDENLSTRLWRYFRSASEDVLKSEEFLNAVKSALKSAEDDKNTTFEDKVIVSRNLKEVMRILKRQPERINRTLRKLNKMLQMLNERIHKLEEMEVTSSSDGESENVYCLLDRHRTRAAKIYSKICELEGKAAHAGRATLQKFHFSGTSGYTKIEHALERYFNKTRLFPDFLDVKKLIEITVEKEKIQISPIQIHNIAQSVFLEFGNKLQRMRKCDDYTMLVDYLDDGTKDPALDDEQLFRKLEENKKNMKKEEEVLAQFVVKEAELKSSGEIKTDEEDAAENDSGDESTKESESEKKNLQFSDTEDELINEDVDSNKKRKLSPDSEAPSLSHKRTMADLDQMEVNLKLVTDVEENRITTRHTRRSSAERDIIMDQLGLTSKGKQSRI